MTITDFITFFLSVFLLLRGASRGFLHSLMGPLSIIVATILSIIYYQDTKDILISLLIGLVGPLGIHLLLKFLLGTWEKATNNAMNPNFLSRLGGAILTLIWGWIFIIFTLLLITLLPPFGKTLAIIRHDITNSESYVSIAKPLEDMFFTAPKQNKPATPVVAASVDAKSLADDPRFQKILQDPDIQNEIASHDFGKLMSNPKIMALTQQIMSDPEEIKKVMAIYRNQITSTELVADNQPKISKNP